MQTLKGISSMATRPVLAELAAAYEAQRGCLVAIESVGGVDAAKRVRAGEAFDLVVLASNTIDDLIAEGHLGAGSKVDLVRSGVAVAVRAGSAQPAIDSEAAVRQAVLAADSLGYSTGPSGVHLARLFERWGIANVVRERIVQPPPGVAVGTLVAAGQVALGFQQLSELMHLEGITVVGPLPPAIQIETIFSAAIGRACAQPDAAQDLLAFMAAPASAATKRRHGMEPASADADRKEIPR